MVVVVVVVMVMVMVMMMMVMMMVMVVVVVDMRLWMTGGEGQHGAGVLEKGYSKSRGGTGQGVSLSSRPCLSCVFFQIPGQPKVTNLAD